MLLLLILENDLTLALETFNSNQFPSGGLFSFERIVVGFEEKRNGRRRGKARKKASARGKAAPY